MFGNLFLTAKGYRALGFTQDQIDQSFQEKPDELGTPTSRKGCRRIGMNLTIRTQALGMRDLRERA